MLSRKRRVKGRSTSSSGSSSSSSGEKEKEAPAKKPKYPPYAEVFRDADDPISGLIKMRRKGGTLYAEISPSQLDRDFIVVMSIARGIGRGSLLAGMSWNFGDDPVWQFRKVDDYIHVVRRNVRFKAEGGSPEEKAVNLAFTDSILFSLPIVTMSPSGGYVVDLNSIFMTDLPQIAHELPGFSFSSQRSSWAGNQGFAGKRRTRSGRHVRLQRLDGKRQHSRHARRDGECALLDQLFAAQQLSSAVWPTIGSDTS